MMAMDRNQHTPGMTSFDSPFVQTVEARRSGFSYLREDDLFDLLGQAGRMVMSAAVTVWLVLVQ